MTDKEIKEYAKEVALASKEKRVTKMNKEQEKRAKKKSLLRDICKSLGIKMSVSGCGCCGSPDFSFEYKGVKLCDNEESFWFDSEKEGED